MKNLNRKSPPTGIHLSNGDKEDHHVFRDNVYFGTTVPVKLVSWPLGNNETDYEDGTCNQRMVTPYQNIPTPNLVIPTYCNQTAFKSACNIGALAGFDD